jgi:hypothetical protein
MAVFKQIRPPSAPLMGVGEVTYLLLLTPGLWLGFHAHTDLTNGIVIHYMITLIVTNCTLNLFIPALNNRTSMSRMITIPKPYLLRVKVVFSQAIQAGREGFTTINAARVKFSSRSKPEARASKFNLLSPLPGRVARSNNHDSDKPMNDEGEARDNDIPGQVETELEGTPLRTPGIQDRKNLTDPHLPGSTIGGPLKSVRAAFIKGINAG